MASGFIYLIILGMWGAYFLPRWISSHEIGSLHAGDRYTSALRSVAESSPFTPEFEDPFKKMRIVGQRRMAFAAITFVLIGSLITATLGLITWSIISIPVSALAIYIVAVRHQIKKANLKTHKIDTLQRILTAEIKIDPTVRIALPAQTLPQEVLAHTTPEYWVPFADREDLDDARVQTVEIRVAEEAIVAEVEDVTWEPVAVPRPTYTTAAKAITPRRTIDVSQGALWSAEQEILSQMNIKKQDEIIEQLLDLKPIDPAVNE